MSVFLTTQQNTTLKKLQLIRFQKILTNISYFSSYHPNKNAYSTNSLQHVNTTNAPQDFCPNSAVVYNNFISSEEGNILEKDILNIMKRKRFEKGHWDAVITDYKEVELPRRQQMQKNQQLRRTLSEESHDVIERVRKHIEQSHFGIGDGMGNMNMDMNHEVKKKENVSWLPVHAIHLKEKGVLSAHVDSVKFSGDIVAGLSLLSPSIMRLKPASPSELEDNDDVNDDDNGTSNNGDKDKKYDKDDSYSSSSKSLDDAGYVDLYLPPLSLYVLSDMSRFKYTHELLDSGQSFTFQDTPCHNDDSDDSNNDDKKGENGIIVHRKDRISVIFRDAKD
jgi:alkylated DNA repair protein alkB family protein 7